MKRAYLQVWCHSERDREIMRDGCSIHVSQSVRDEYVHSVYSKRSSDVPSEYDYVCDSTHEVYLDDGLSSVLLEKGTIRIDEPSFSNLLRMDEIIIK